MVNRKRPRSPEDDPSGDDPAELIDDGNLSLEQQVDVDQLPVSPYTNRKFHGYYHAIMDAIKNAGGVASSTAINKFLQANYPSHTRNISQRVAWGRALKALKDPEGPFLLTKKGTYRWQIRPTLGETRVLQIVADSDLHKITPTEFYAKLVRMCKQRVSMDYEGASRREMLSYIRAQWPTVGRVAKRWKRRLNPMISAANGFVKYTKPDGTVKWLVTVKEEPDSDDEFELFRQTFLMNTAGEEATEPGPEILNQTPFAKTEEDDDDDDFITEPQADTFNLPSSVKIEDDDDDDFEGFDIPLPSIEQEFDDAMNTHQARVDSYQPSSGFNTMEANQSHVADAGYHHMFSSLNALDGYPRPIGDGYPRPSGNVYYQHTRSDSNTMDADQPHVTNAGYNPMLSSVNALDGYPRPIAYQHTRSDSNTMDAAQPNVNNTADYQYTSPKFSALDDSPPTTSNGDRYTPDLNVLNEYQSDDTGFGYQYAPSDYNAVDAQQPDGNNLGYLPTLPRSNTLDAYQPDVTDAGYQDAPPSEFNAMSTYQPYGNSQYAPSEFDAMNAYQLPLSHQLKPYDYKFNTIERVYQTPVDDQQSSSFGGHRLNTLERVYRPPVNQTPVNQTPVNEQQSSSPGGHKRRKLDGESGQAEYQQLEPSKDESKWPFVFHL
ncbi:uncharacterized protein K452DRAFT_355411 [Aplosporella prunicola CBS 121167]|uniref:Uncharacterized protein n=1 Tax=Aplosporella prunicola CBS 121167 TaxID=1176127 RepID=A0A6A6BQ74_9PEZI|nr:uncharacterized protein K452DRAFT_355411 [Aplosporella prunicola CBS 121167]KAF2145898.1 hypothetical protein K452DRAFT_355411 [Aplosporella prunicola CBS 121167]